MCDDIRNLPMELAKVANLEFLRVQYENESERPKIEQRIVAALMSYPNHGVALAARGWSSFAKDDFEDAAIWFQRALNSKDVTPEREAEWLTYLGGCRLRCGDWKSAVNNLVLARAIFPRKPRCHFVLGATFREIGDMVSSKLSMALAAYLTGEIEPEDLFGKLVQEPVFADPVRFEASLRVLAEPLDASVRIHRGEAMVALESPKAALYDFMMADAVAHGNLGVLVRIEEIQVKGLLVGPPVYETPKIDRPLAPVFDEFLTAFRDAYHARFMPPELQPPLGPVERIFGPSRYIPSTNPWSFFALPMCAGLVGFLAFALPIPLGFMLFGEIDVKRLGISMSDRWLAYSLTVVSRTFAAAFGLAAVFWIVFGSYWYVMGLMRLSERIKGWLAFVLAIPIFMAWPTLIGIYAAFGALLLGPPVLAGMMLYEALGRVPAEYAVPAIFVGVIGLTNLIARRCGFDLTQPVFSRTTPQR